VTRPPDGWRPLVSIVTPSLNQGRFLGAAIDSVQGQGYPHVEHLVLDGGSTDGTLDVLRSYGRQMQAGRLHHKSFAWTSESDAGQSDAIARGFERARGDVLTWLNADDVLAPGAVERAVAELASAPEAGLVYGRGVILDQDGAETGPFAGIEPFSLWRLLHVLDYVLQPAAFFRRDAYRAAGGLDRGLHWAMDWDLWIRLAGVAEVRFVDRVLAGSREWQDTKTATGGWRRIRELGRLTTRHAGRFWTPGVRLYALDTLRRRLRAAAPPLARAVDAAVAFAARRVIAGVAVHADGWLGPRASLVVPRRWRGFEVELEAHRLPPRGRFDVRFSAEGTDLGVWTVEKAVSRQLSFALPAAGEGPFVEVGVDSDFCFRSAGDRRRLSVRCARLAPPGLVGATSV
jgi:Glycosyl transferase family 2